MMKLLCHDDFKHKKINPNWSPFDILLQVTEVDQLKLQKSRHNDYLKHFLYDAPPHNMCFKLRFKFNNGIGLKRKHTLATLEEEDDREREAPKPKLKRSKKQYKPNGWYGFGFGHPKDHLLLRRHPTASRFSIPFSQVKTHDFLNEAEAKELAHKNPMQVCLLDPSLKQTSITFNKWVMGNTSLYVLTNT
ncbi:B3 domain-containing protein [Gossypium australe]|uniref:B3 domain-containing protein n=1 Tax=Gossypium australe TaxID=47621 RepID=A0A5B6VIT0_9ROSI|nr:B3 domain-containing protein [Gossypium australe]